MLGRGKRELVSLAVAQRRLTPFGNVCNYRRKFTEHEKLMLILSTFPEILVSYFIMMALPPVLLSSKTSLQSDPKFYFNLMLSTFRLFRLCVLH